MAAEIWRTKCSHCGAVVRITDATPSREESDGSTSYVAVCRACDGKATYRRKAEVAPAAPAVATKPNRSLGKTAFNAVWVWLLVIVAIRLAISFATTVRDAVNYDPKPPPFTSGNVTTPAPTRDQIALLFKGRGEAFVLEAVKRPKETQQTGASSTWFYDGFSYDPVAKKLDTWTVLHFENGVVTYVSFF